MGVLCLFGLLFCCWLFVWIVFFVVFITLCCCVTVGGVFWVCFVTFRFVLLLFGWLFVVVWMGDGCVVFGVN